MRAATVISCEPLSITKLFTVSVEGANGFSFFGVCMVSIPVGSTVHYNEDCDLFTPDGKLLSYRL